MPPSPRLALAAAATTALLAVAGCGADDEPAARPGGGSAAPSVSYAAVAGPLDGATFVDGLIEAIDAESTVHLTIDAPGSGTAEVDVKYDDFRSVIKVDADLDFRGRQMLVIAGGVVYVDQGDGSWATIDKTDPSYGSLLRTFTQIGPHDSVAGLRSGIESITEDGTDLIDGVELTVYRAMVSPDKATGAFKALAGTSGIDEAIPFTLYVDQRGLLRRVEASVSGQTATVTLDDWSKPVSITVPHGARPLEG